MRAATAAHRLRLLVGVQPVPLDETGRSETETQTVAHGCPQHPCRLSDPASRPILARQRAQAPGSYTRATGVPRATRLRSHPSNLIRVMPAKGGR